jgi:hypothetical protein
MATAPVDTTAVEYTRRLYANVVAWYENADRKAQLILTANGGFLTVLTAFILSKPIEVQRTVGVFGPETWLFAGVAATSIVVAFVAAALVLWSRLMTHGKAHGIFEAHGVRLRDPATYDPSVLWFFQLVRRLDQDALESRLAAVTPQDEVEALVDQIIPLSQRVTRKHIWVNVGFVATATGLSCLVATTASYVLRLAS